MNLDPMQISCLVLQIFAKLAPKDNEILHHKTLIEALQSIWISARWFNPFAPCHEKGTVQTNFQYFVPSVVPLNKKLTIRLSKSNTW